MWVEDFVIFSYFVVKGELEVWKFKFFKESKFVKLFLF